MWIRKLIIFLLVLVITYFLIKLIGGLVLIWIISDVPNKDDKITYQTDID